jgi:hypothetical protein
VEDWDWKLLVAGYAALLSTLNAYVLLRRGRPLYWLEPCTPKGDMTLSVHNTGREPILISNYHVRPRERVSVVPADANIKQVLKQAAYNRIGAIIDPDQTRKFAVTPSGEHQPFALVITWRPLTNYPFPTIPLWFAMTPRSLRRVQSGERAGPQIFV